MKQMRMTHSEPHYDDSEQAIARRERFLDLFQQSYQVLFRLACAITGSRPDAEDALQETILLAWEKFDQLESESKFSRWASKIVSRVARSNVKRRQQRGEVTLNEGMTERIGRLQAGSVELMELRRERLKDCMSQLTSRDLELIHQCYGTRESLKSMADRRGWNIKTVYSRINRLKIKLHECVERKMGRLES